MLNALQSTSRWLLSFQGCSHSGSMQGRQNPAMVIPCINIGAWKPPSSFAPSLLGVRNAKTRKILLSRGVCVQRHKLVHLAAQPVAQTLRCWPPKKKHLKNCRVPARSPQRRLSKMLKAFTVEQVLYVLYGGKWPCGLRALKGGVHSQ